MGCIILSAMCNVNLFAMWVFLISHIFRPWHFEQRTKKNYWRHCFTLFTQLSFWILELFSWHSSFCWKTIAYWAVYSAGCICRGFDVVLVLFIKLWTLGTNICTFFSVTLWISLLVSLSRYFSLYRSLLWEYQL